MSQRSVTSAAQQLDPLEDTQRNPDLPRMLAMRAAHALNHLDPRTAPRTDASAEKKAARAALVYALIVIAVIAATVVALPHVKA